MRLRVSHLTNCTCPPDQGTTAGLRTLHGFLRPSGHAIQVLGAALTFAPATSILTPIDHNAKVLWLPASLRLSRPQQAKAVGALCLHTGAHKPWIPSSLV
jgi:hypothetical protein